MVSKLIRVGGENEVREGLKESLLFSQIQIADHEVFLGGGRPVCIMITQSLSTSNLKTLSRLSVTCSRTVAGLPFLNEAVGRVVLMLDLLICFVRQHSKRPPQRLWIST